MTLSVIETKTTTTVKREIFTCPLFRKFRDLNKFVKITGRKYSNGNFVYCITISSSTKAPKLKAPK